MELFETGLTVLSVGFFVVFMFLTILIIAMTIMGKVVSYLNKVFPVAQAELAGSKPALKTAGSADEEIAVAIAAVLMR